MIKKKKTKPSKQLKSKRKPRASFLEGPIHKTKIRIVGIGGGGNSIVSEIIQRITSPGEKKISFAVANTDSQALRKTSTKARRFHFGQDLTSGLGTGMNPELGKEAAQKEKEKIAKILKNQDLIILVACLGGGVGSGAAPVLAEVSKKLGNLTYGIFTLPFKFEGEKKMEIAKSALRKLRRRLNTLTIIPNERIFQIVDKTTPLTNALSIINKNLAKSLEALLEMIYQPGLINIDFADLRAILRGGYSSFPKQGFGRIAYLNTIEIKGKNRVQKTVKELISTNPLYPYTISGAKGILFNISGEKSLKLSVVNQISQAIWELVKGKAKIIFGISKSQKLKDKIKITLLATGCKSRIPLSKKRPERKKSVKRRKKAKTTKKAKIEKGPKKTKPKTKKTKKKEKRKIKKTKIKINLKISAATKEKKENKLPSGPAKKEEKDISPKIRRNALQVKKALKEEEERLLAEEKKWESPAFLRRNK